MNYEIEINMSRKIFNLTFCPLQVFLQIDARSVNKPVWVILTSTGSSSGVDAMPVRIKPPGCIPITAGSGCMFFQVVGVPEDLVRFNVKKGIFLYIPQIRNIMNARGIPIPKKPFGSGKDGAIKKQDLALHLGKGLLPDVDAAECQRMVAAITGKGAVKNPDEILKLVGHLKEKELSHFSKLRDDAVKELEQRNEEEEKKKKRLAKLHGTEQPSTPRAPIERPDGALHIGRGAGVPKHVTARGKAPQEIKDLLPPGVGTCYINMNMTKRNCTVEFRRALFSQ